MSDQARHTAVQATPLLRLGLNQRPDILNM